MKILKMIGLGIAGLILLFLIVPVFLSSTTTVSRSTTINAPSDSIYNFLSDFNNFTKWSPWYQMEPTAKVTVEGAGVGSKYSWVGKEVGSGNMTIASLDANKAVNIRLEFTEPFKSLATTKWSVEPAEGGSKVSWEMSQDLSYFMRYMGLMMDGMVGKDFDKGLSNLKTSIEKK